MSDSCAQHRPYLGALADGESGLVMGATLDHVRDCERCAEEVALHCVVGEVLRAGAGRATASTGRQRTTAHRRRRVAVAVAAIAAGLTVVAGGASVGQTLSHRGGDPVVLAVAAAQQPPVLVSGDSNQIAEWCSRQSVRPEPSVRLTSLVPQGARMDRPDGVHIVTVFYASPSGGRVAIAWFDGEHPGAAPEVDSRQVSGRPVLVVTTAAATAVVSGDASAETLWRAAADLETSAG